MARDRPLTAQGAAALQWLTSREHMTVSCGPNQFIHDEISKRTAWALENRGYAERRWVGGRDGTIYITDAGREEADRLLNDNDNPHCPNGCKIRMIWTDDAWFCPECEDEWPEGEV